MTNKTPIYWPLPTEILFVFDTHFGKKSNDGLFILKVLV